MNIDFYSNNSRLKSEELVINFLENKIQSNVNKLNELPDDLKEIIGYEYLKLREYLQKHYFEYDQVNNISVVSLIFYLIQYRRESLENLFYLAEIVQLINTPFFFYFSIYDKSSVLEASKKFKTINSIRDTHFQLSGAKSNISLSTYKFSTYFEETKEFLELLYNVCSDIAVCFQVSEVLSYFTYCIIDNEIEDSQYEDTFRIALEKAVGWDIYYIYQQIAVIKNLALIKYAVEFADSKLTFQKNLNSQNYCYNILKGLQIIIDSIACIKGRHNEIFEILELLKKHNKLIKPVEKALYKQERLKSGKIQNYKNPVDVHYGPKIYYNSKPVYEEVSSLRIVDYKKFFNIFISESWRNDEEKNLIDANVKKVKDEVRDDFGVSRIGEQWKNETFLYDLLSKLMKKKNIHVMHHYRPKFLKGQELDIYFEYDGLKIGIEYQGRQHFEPIDFFGGEEGFKATLKRDRQKKELCEKEGINLIYFDYSEIITNSLIIEKLKKYNIS